MSIRRDAKKFGKFNNKIPYYGQTHISSAILSFYCLSMVDTIELPYEKTMSFM